VSIVAQALVDIQLGGMPGIELQQRLAAPGDRWRSPSSTAHDATQPEPRALEVIAPPVGDHFDDARNE